MKNKKYKQLIYKQESKLICLSTRGDILQNYEVSGDKFKSTSNRKFIF
jgi:hypothetical protein